MTDYRKDPYFLMGNFGIERESFRVDGQGSFAKSRHPFEGDSFLERDFSESQLEIITPVADSVRSAMDELRKLDIRVEKELKKKEEYLWMYSNPPVIRSGKDIVVAQYKGEQAAKKEYRRKLQQKYGKKLMAYSGIHFNFSFHEDGLRWMYEQEHPWREISFQQYSDDLYFRMFKQICEGSWILVLLTAASPVFDRSLISEEEQGDAFDGYASRRSGEKGYWNTFTPVLDFLDLGSYARSAWKYVESGDLIAESELYLPVRLKSNGVNSLRALNRNGVNHIELRMFDLNPLAELGIHMADLEFAHYLLIYLLSLPDFEFTEELQREAIRNHKEAARFDLEEIRISGCPGREKILGVLEDMKEYYSDFPKVLENIRFQEEKITGSLRYCEVILRDFGQDYMEKMLTMAKIRRRCKEPCVRFSESV